MSGEILCFMQALKERFASIYLKCEEDGSYSFTNRFLKDRHQTQCLLLVQLKNSAMVSNLLQHITQIIAQDVESLSFLYMLKQFIICFDKGCPSQFIVYLKYYQEFRDFRNKINGIHLFIDYPDYLSYQEIITQNRIGKNSFTYWDGHIIEINLQVQDKSTMESRDFSLSLQEVFILQRDLAHYRNVHYKPIIPERLLIFNSSIFINLEQLFFYDKSSLSNHQVSIGPTFCFIFAHFISVAISGDWCFTASHVCQYLKYYIFETYIDLDFLLDKNLFKKKDFDLLDSVSLQSWFHYIEKWFQLYNVDIKLKYVGDGLFAINYDKDCKVAYLERLKYFTFLLDTAMDLALKNNLRKSSRGKTFNFKFTVPSSSKIISQLSFTLDNFNKKFINRFPVKIKDFYDQAQPSQSSNQLYCDSILSYEDCLKRLKLVTQFENNISFPVFEYNIQEHNQISQGSFSVTKRSKQFQQQSLISTSGLQKPLFQQQDVVLNKPQSFQSKALSLLVSPPLIVEPVKKLIKSKTLAQVKQRFDQESKNQQQEEPLKTNLLKSDFFRHEIYQIYEKQLYFPLQTFPAFTSELSFFINKLFNQLSPEQKESSVQYERIFGCFVFNYIVYGWSPFKDALDSVSALDHFISFNTFLDFLDLNDCFERMCPDEDKYGDYINSIVNKYKDQLEDKCKSYSGSDAVAIQEAICRLVFFIKMKSFYYFFPIEDIYKFEENCLKLFEKCNLFKEVYYPEIASLKNIFKNFLSDNLYFQQLQVHAQFIRRRAMEKQSLENQVSKLKINSEEKYIERIQQLEDELDHQKKLNALHVQHANYINDEKKKFQQIQRFIDLGYSLGEVFNALELYRQKRFDEEQEIKRKQFRQEFESEIQENDPSNQSPERLLNQSQSSQQKMAILLNEKNNLTQSFRFAQDECQMNSNKRNQLLKSYKLSPQQVQQIDQFQQQQQSNQNIERETSLANSAQVLHSYNGSYQVFQTQNLNISSSLENLSLLKQQFELYSSPGSKQQQQNNLSVDVNQDQIQSTNNQSQRISIQREHEKEITHQQQIQNEQDSDIKQESSDNIQSQFQVNNSLNVNEFKPISEYISNDQILLWFPELKDAFQLSYFAFKVDLIQKKKNITICRLQLKDNYRVVDDFTINPLTLDYLEKLSYLDIKNKEIRKALDQLIENEKLVIQKCYQPEEFKTDASMFIMTLNDFYCQFIQIIFRKRFSDKTRHSYKNAKQQKVKDKLLSLAQRKKQGK